MRSNMTEHDVYSVLAAYLRIHYPDAIYRFDLAADLKLTPGQAAKHKKLQGRGYPDLFIAEPRGGHHGLFIEIKRTRDDYLRKTDGKLKAGDHLAEQAEMLERLRNKGYMTTFAAGADGCAKVIDDYMAL